VDVRGDPPLVAPIEALEGEVVAMPDGGDEGVV
jgi:hypothetical protein